LKKNRFGLFSAKSFNTTDAEYFRLLNTLITSDKLLKGLFLLVLSS